ncbi:uncharacterized protein LOC131216464 [Anopheles bellator]|uniref:uncharacterized protein LOC131216464 n=1 Tax=Anopheles bellator TaxID=139047 RepID=UPI0026497B8C|nr:uncharacterized protein LOC131216464 [Anopheles bellator]
MESSIHELNNQPAHGNGKAPAADGWHGNGQSKEDVAGAQRPRRLSFNGSDMELSDLKGHRHAADGSWKNRESPIDTKQMLVLLAAATTIAVSVRYLLPVLDVATFRTFVSQSVAVAGIFWNDLCERIVRLRPTMASWDRMVPHAEQTAYVLSALAFGLLVSSFTWYVVYLDSSIPGVNPPTPFSASKKRYRGGSLSKERRFHLGYITAMISGLVVFLILVLSE